MSWESRVVPKALCAHCGYESDRAATESGEKPEPGDISICLGCGGVNFFGPDLTQRKPTALEILELPPAIWQEVQRIQRARDQIKKGKTR